MFQAKVSRLCNMKGSYFYPAIIKVYYPVDSSRMREWPDG
jgi:hypothetical protein